MTGRCCNDVGSIIIQGRSQCNRMGRSGPATWTIHNFTIYSLHTSTYSLLTIIVIWITPIMISTRVDYTYNQLWSTTNNILDTDMKYTTRTWTCDISYYEPWIQRISSIPWCRGSTAHEQKMAREAPKNGPRGSFCPLEKNHVFFWKLRNRAV